MIGRYKPIGWRNDNYRHSLAARGLTRQSFKAIRSYEKNPNPFVMSDVPVAFEGTYIMPKGFEGRNSGLIRQTSPHPMSYGDTLHYPNKNDSIISINDILSEEQRADLARTEIMEELYPKTSGRNLIVRPIGPQTEQQKMFSELEGIDSEYGAYNYEKLPDDVLNNKIIALEILTKKYPDEDYYDQKNMEFDLEMAKEEQSKRKQYDKELNHLSPQHLLHKYKRDPGSFWNPSSGGSPFDGKPGEYQ